jgi:hypothetical protein
MTNADALEVQVRAVGVSDVWAAEVELCRGLARAVDSNPDDPNLWREYRQALKALREVLRSHDSEPSEDLDAEFASVGGSGVRDVEESGPAD